VEKMFSQISHSVYSLLPTVVSLSFLCYGIFIRTAAHGKRNQLVIHDTGPGIPTHVLPYIFDSFFTTKKNSGAGIGLSFCRKVMSAFGGHIQCESVIGQYTQFVLEFPQAG
jgi:signal transduction histidine kinase